MKSPGDDLCVARFSNVAFLRKPKEASAQKNNWLVPLIAALVGLGIGIGLSQLGS
jgi:hypothetical protein